MAVQAPLHLQGVLGVHEGHLIHASVTTFATYAFIYVNAVVEIHEIRKIVHARPLQRLAGAEAIAYWLQQIGVGPDLRVAIHAGLGRRDSGKVRLLYGRVAIAAVEPQSRNVVLMAEWDWLVGSNVLPRHVRRPLQLEQRRANRGKQKDHAQYAGARQCVRTAM